MADRQRQSVRPRRRLAISGSRPLDRLVLLLPVLMWVAAALITWLLVSRLLIRPLKRLERAVAALSSPARRRSTCRASSARRDGDPGAARRLRPRDRPRRRIRARDGQRARRPAAAGPRSPSPGEEQPPGGRLAAQHPRPERRHAPKRARPMPGSAAGSARCRSSTATISRRWRRIAGSRCGRW